MITDEPLPECPTPARCREIGPCTDRIGCAEQRARCTCGESRRAIGLHTSHCPLYNPQEN